MYVAEWQLFLKKIIEKKTGCERARGREREKHPKTVFNKTYPMVYLANSACDVELSPLLAAATQVEAVFSFPIFLSHPRCLRKSL